MNIAGQDHMAAVIVLVGALLATVIALSSHSDPSTQPTSAEHAVAATTALDIDLARCKALGPEARNDAACQKAWRIVSRRFFEYVELRYGLAVDPPSETPGQEVAAARLRGEPTGTLKSPSRPDPDSPRSAADIAGQPR
jgi:conjugative transfer region protein TrbK